jgi:hypothetical protein
MRKSRRVIRAKIVIAAARLLGCNLREFFIRAMPDKRDIKVNLNNIPEEVFVFAKKVFDESKRHRAEPPRRVVRERYRRVVPALAFC